MARQYLPLAGPADEPDAGAGFAVTRDEFLDIFFDELALPNLVKRQLARIDEYKRVRAGYTQSGVPTNIKFKK